MTHSRFRWLPGLIPAVLLAALLLVSAMNPRAQPAGNRIIDQAYITEIDGRIAIQVEFPCPVRYASHFPQDTGSELRVRVVPVRFCAADREELRRRESVRPADAEVAGLLEVTYEGDMEGGPFITFDFSQPVAFELYPAPDFRGLTVIIDALLENPEPRDPPQGNEAGQ